MEVIKALLDREAQDEDFDLCLEVQNHAKSEGWLSIVEEALAILSDREKPLYWRSAANIIFWSPKTELPIPKMQVVARLYWCLIHGGEGIEDAENLVWSIAKDLKGVGYLSEWDPMQDPEVAKYLADMGE